MRTVQVDERGHMFYRGWDVTVYGEYDSGCGEVVVRPERFVDGKHRELDSYSSLSQALDAVDREEDGK